MKIILTTTFLVAVLAIDLFGVSNVFAQGDDMMEKNDTGMMNATLAFAQGEGNDTISMGNETSMMMNAIPPMSIIGNDTAKP
jgi:hypothetical protein